VRPVRIYLVRHAEAAPGEPDALRALTAKGHADAEALGLRLRDELEAVVTSPLLRARQTGAALADAAGVEARVDERLAPGAEPDDVRAAAAGRGETVAVVGHQPDFGLAAAELTGLPPPPFPPCGWLAVELA
jgi:phosphohistidine phosphatase